MEENEKKTDEQMVWKKENKEDECEANRGKEVYKTKKEVRKEGERKKMKIRYEERKWEIRKE